MHRSTKPCTACKTLIHHKANAPYQGRRVTSARGPDTVFQQCSLRDCSWASFVIGYEVSGWYGVGAPMGTPVEVIDELNKEIMRALPQIKGTISALKELLTATAFGTS